MNQQPPRDEIASAGRHFGKSIESITQIETSEVLSCVSNAIIHSALVEASGTATRFAAELQRNDFAESR